MTIFNIIFSNLWKSKRILMLTSYVELKKRYVGSVLGIGWVLLYPAFLLGMYMFIYQAIFKVKITGIDSPFEYSLFVLSGIIPYLGLAETLNASILSLSQNRHLIANVIAPMEIIPMRVVCVAMASQCMGLLILMAILLFSGSSISFYWLYVPFMLIIQFFFLCGLSFIFAIIGVVMRDLVQLMGVFTLFLLVVSPVGYTKEMVPEYLQNFLYLNPLWYMVESFRQPLLYGQLPDPFMLCIYLGATIFIFCLGGYLFKKALYFMRDLI